MWDHPELPEFNLEFESGMLQIPTLRNLRRTEITGTIRKIHIYCWPVYGTLEGLRFYDADGKCIYESACSLSFNDDDGN